MEKLIGRKKECEELRWALDSDRSEFIVLYGRRRIGKTFLVRRFFNDTYCFHYVGAHNKPKNDQLENFRETLLKYTGSPVPSLGSWRDAFRLLEQFLEQCQDDRKVIFFDEMPWMDTHGNEFIEELEYFWANWVQNRDDIVFIACGSATSWMKDKLEDNQGGLHNRITHRIYLRPFYLSECKEYLQERGMDWSEYQMMQCYMILGGVPYYWSLLNRHMSLADNIDNLLFKRGGILRDEFNQLYNALFNKADKYIQLVKFLSTKREGYTRSEIGTGTGNSGGGLTKMLDNLERCDFIIAYNHYGNKKKLTLYRLSDFYSIFYFRYIENNRSRDEHYWQHHCTDRSIETWQGFSFEQLCLQHLLQIKVGLGIAGIATEASTWRFVPKKDDDRNGAQVDLVIKRRDGLIHLIEMKFASEPYVISKEYERRLLERKALFGEVTKASNTVITFITPYGVSPNKHAGIMHTQVTGEDLFANITKFE